MNPLPSLIVCVSFSENQADVFIVPQNSVHLWAYVSKHSPIKFVELTVLVYGLVWSFKILSYQTVRKLSK